MTKDVVHFWIIFQMVSSSVSYAMNREPDVDHSSGTLENQTQVRYTPQKLIFPVVSEGNCRRLPGGALSNCEFPAIDFREIYPNLPPLPFESLIRVQVSRSCDLSGPVGFLKVRMGKYGTLAPKESQYLQSDHLSIHGDHIRTLKHPASLPLGQLTIYPRSTRIFSNFMFASDCKINLEIEFNAIAIHSSIEAADYLVKLNTQLNLLKRAGEAFSFLQERIQAQQVLGGITELVHGRAVEIGAMKLEWERIVRTLQGYKIPTFSEYSHLFEQFMENHAISLETILDCVRSFQFEETPLEGRIQDMDSNTLAEYQFRIEKAENDVQLATKFLNPLHLETVQQGICRRDFQSIVYQEICEPHGILDEIMDALKQIGRRT